MTLQRLQANQPWDKRSENVLNSWPKQLEEISASITALTALVVSASTTTAGLIAIATDEEAKSASVSTKALVPSNLAALSGTYTPTLTNGANVAASTAYSAQYVRIGSVVTVSGRCDIDPTAAASTLTELGISLPIASNFTALEHCCGTAAARPSIIETGTIVADAANDRATLEYLSQTTANHGLTFTFTYRIL